MGEDRHQFHVYLNDNLGEFASAHRIVQVDEERYWFITDRKAALVKFSGSHKPEILMETDYRDYGFIMLDNRENIIPAEGEKPLVCIHNGLALISHDIMPGHGTKPALFLSGMLSFSDKNGKSARLSPECGKTYEIP